MLLPADPRAETGPVAVVTGIADLVYRDPATQEYVIVDYKTDALRSEAERAERTLRHARQGAVYQRALREALGLPSLPRFELWYLRADAWDVVATPPPSG